MFDEWAADQDPHFRAYFYEKLLSDLKERGKPRSEIQLRMGLRDFAVRKTMEQAEKYTITRIKEVYDRLLETDLAVKTGRLDGDLALNILIAELARK